MIFSSKLLQGKRQRKERKKNKERGEVKGSHDGRCEAAMECGVDWVLPE